MEAMQGDSAQDSLPTIALGDARLSRLIVGGNPFSGNSHVSEQLDQEMEAYHTVARIKETLRRCEECGVATAQLRADKHISRLLAEYRAEGGSLNWVAQTAPEYYPFEANLNLIRKTGPAAVYHHGTVTDALYKAGETRELRRRLEAMRRLGVPVGLGTHMPELVARAEEESWGLDFYMTCVYNLSKVDRVSKEVSGRISNGEPFDAEDPPLMYQVVREVPKPCLVFKILGATRRCGSQAAVKAAFAEAYASIKPTDAVVVGVYQRDLDQVALNASYARELLAPGH